MIEIRRTLAFEKWLDKLRDRQARARIILRLRRFEDTGNPGDAKNLGDINEMRIDSGPGYRLYFVMRRQVVVILLCGGDKSSQKTDIERARLLAKDL